MKLIFLPPYSSELNPAEHLWKDPRERWFANTVFKSLEAVEDILSLGLRTMEERLKEPKGSLAFIELFLSIEREIA